MSFDTGPQAQARLEAGMIGLMLGTWALAMGASEPPEVAGRDAGALPGCFPAESLVWECRLGTHQFTIPCIDSGQLFVGMNDLRLSHPVLKRTGGGILMCLDPATGRMEWQLIIPRNMGGTKAPFHFNHWKCGVCSRPALESKRLFIVGSRGEILCLDRRGQADGNDGPFLDEKQYMGVPDPATYTLRPDDGDIVWRFDMIQELGVVPHDVCGSSPLLHGSFLYACTSNGVDDQHKAVANPEAPSLIVLDKETGQLVATDGEMIGRRLFHGLWSSPVAATFNGQDRILFGGGDGVLYAFEPVLENPGSASTGPAVLKKVWEHDCVPPDYRQRNGQRIPYSKWNNNSREGPSEIIATPVVDGNRIYVAIGQSPVHGPGLGMLSCVDGTDGGTVWENRQIERTLSDAAVDGDLVYIADYSGRLFCLEAATGEVVWQHELEAGVWCASPAVIDGKVYISTEKQILWVLKAGRQKEVLAQSRLRSMAITPVADEKTIYFPTQLRLFTVKR